MSNAISFSSVVSRDVFNSGSLSDQSMIDLESYFVAVKTRYESGEQYPYDLEELVPTVFTSKHKAVAALTKDFTQDIDFAHSTVRLSGTPTPREDYRLSPLAFEFMAARKCKAIFSLYHRVFHMKTAEQSMSASAKIMELCARLQKQIEQNEATIAALTAAQNPIQHPHYRQPSSSKPLMTIGQKMRLARQQAMLSQFDVANQVGCEQQYISKLERDKGDNPSRAMLEKIASVINIPVTELLISDLPTGKISAEAELIGQNYDLLDERDQAQIRVIIMRSSAMRCKNTLPA